MIHLAPAIDQPETNLPHTVHENVSSFTRFNCHDCINEKEAVSYEISITDNQFS